MLLDFPFACKAAHGRRVTDELVLVQALHVCDAFHAKISVRCCDFASTASRFLNRFVSSAECERLGVGAGGGYHRDAFGFLRSVKIRNGCERVTCFNGIGNEEGVGSGQSWSTQRGNVHRVSG